jgi:hypothetical protein
MNCLLCDILVPELEEAVARQSKQIKELKQIIENLKNDNDGKRNGVAIRHEAGNGQAS